MNKNHFGDEQLTAYLDGELDEATEDAIRSRLQSDPALRARLGALQFDESQLKSSFEALLGDAPEMPQHLAPVETFTESHPPNRQWRSLAAVAFLVACVSSLATLWATRQNMPGNNWFDYVAAYQALYTTETLAPITPDPVTREAELLRVSSAVNHPLELASLTDLAGLQYMRSQVLGFRSRPLAQLTFLTPDGDPIAICIIATDNAEAPIRNAQLEGMASTRWVDNGFAYLVIGGTDQEALTDIAENFKSRI